MVPKSKPINFARCFIWTTKKSIIVPVSKIVNFKVDQQNKKRAYKIKSDNGIQEGFITDFGATEDDLKEKTGKRSHVPPRKVVETATELSTDDELRPDKKSKQPSNRKAPHSIEKINSHLAERLESTTHSSLFGEEENPRTPLAEISNHPITAKSKPIVTRKKQPAKIKIASNESTASSESGKSLENGEQSLENLNATVQINCLVTSTPPIDVDSVKSVENFSFARRSESEKTTHFQNVTAPVTNDKSSESPVCIQQDQERSNSALSHYSEKSFSEETIVDKRRESRIGSLSDIVNNYKGECRNISEQLKSKNKELKASKLKAAELEAKLEEISTRLENVLKENEELRHLNRQSQYFIHQKMDTIHDTIKMHSQAMQIQEESLDSPVGMYNADRSKLYMGREQWISTETYADVMSTEKSFPKIVKRFAIDMFGKEVLRKSTVTGFSSNRSNAGRVPTETLSSAKLLAIRDFYSFALQKEKSMSRNSADMEAWNTLKYISKQISDLKNPPRKRVRKVNKKRKTILGAMPEDNATENLDQYVPGEDEIEYVPGEDETIVEKYVPGENEINFDEQNPLDEAEITEEIEYEEIEEIEEIEEEYMEEDMGESMDEDMEEIDGLIF